jgi:DNA replication and repair protein RecF
MSITTLSTHNFRNLASVNIDLHPSLNFFVGDNGSGKSSLLEALFFLGHGKSFRTSKLEILAHYDVKNFVVTVKNTDSLLLGLSKDFSNGNTLIKINGKRYTRLSDLAKHIAVQIITPESFKLFFGGPKIRRRFFELGMFHVKHHSSDIIRQFNQTLKQRNACLRNGLDKQSYEYWTQAFCKLSNQVGDIRSTYISDLIAELPSWLAILLPSLVDSISVQYQQGWPAKKSLAESFYLNYERERALGYSIYGAHKFDVKFMVGRQPLDTQLSRGQQKLFLLALTFAQARLIARVNRVKPILLIDDFGAELDKNSRKLLVNAIVELDSQVLITAIDKEVLGPFLKDLAVSNIKFNDKQKYHMFHVEQGGILPVNNSIKIE